MFSNGRNALAIAIGAVVLLSTCLTVSVDASVASKNPARTVASHSEAFVVLHNGANSGFTRQSEFVIRDADEFTRRWRGVLQGTPDAVKPEIDFGKTNVVFVAIGSRNTGGYTVHVDSLTREATHATVHYTVGSPGARCMSLQELTSPIEVISFDRIEGEIKFRKRGVSGRC